MHSRKRYAYYEDLNYMRPFKSFQHEITEVLPFTIIPPILQDLQAESLRFSPIFYSIRLISNR